MPQLQHEARALLEQGKVDYILGFEPGTLKFSTTPLITKNKEDCARLVVNPFIANNLSVYLPKLKGRLGIVVKGCDSRSVVSLIQDNKVARDRVVIIGVPCAGIIDLDKIEQLVSRERDEIDDIVRQGDRVAITLGNGKKEFPLVSVLADNCLACETPIPKECDILLDPTDTLVTDPSAGQQRIQEVESKSVEERWAFWEKQFERCIRCYACRSVCPVCFCERCFAEETEPQWVSPAPHWQDNMSFQIIRSLHVAGRCTDCGNCERACPVNIPLRSLSKKMVDLVDELFDYKAGTDKSALPLMASYEADEAEGVFR
ncbi:MAG: 4Fe-4S dicluster domain-containing protein [Chloroflexi bacterium]|nr:4Fe-4S dicluster domain-containing protein [Chloroflexota bacterium]